MFSSSLFFNLVRKKLHLKGVIALVSLGLFVSCSKPQAMDKVLFNNEVTPLEGSLTRNSFRITHQNKELPYQGRLYKRGKPSTKDYITLQPLTSLKTDIRLNSYYPITHTGKYTIAYRTSYLSTKNTQSLIKLKASNLTHFIVVEPHK